MLVSVPIAHGSGGNARKSQGRVGNLLGASSQSTGSSAAHEDVYI